MFMFSFLVSNCSFFFFSLFRKAKCVCLIVSCLFNRKPRKNVFVNSLCFLFSTSLNLLNQSFHEN